MWFSLCISGLAIAVGAQRVYITTSGTEPRPQCTQQSPSPTFSFQPFSYTLNETVRYVFAYPEWDLLSLMSRYAPSVSSPTTTRTFAPAYTDAVRHLTSLSTTTWGNWLPGKTVIRATDTDRYGQAAWSSMWLEAKLENYVCVAILVSTSFHHG